MLAAHHMVLDGWAVGLLLRELFARHAALTGSGTGTEATEPSVPVAALTGRQEALRARGAWDAQAGFWKSHLHGVPTTLELPADRQRPAVQDAAGERIGLDLGPAVSAAVTRRARALGITPYAFLLGAFGLALGRRTGARSLLVGVPLLGRQSGELERLVAVAGNLVPVRVDLDDEASPGAYLRSVHSSLGRSIDAKAICPSRSWSPGSASSAASAAIRWSRSASACTTSSCRGASTRAPRTCAWRRGTEAARSST